MGSEMCIRDSIEVVRPDINECFADFRTIDNKFYYALGGIKAVGYEAISNIVEERILNGKFDSIHDFINRVNPKDINKLQLEGLVKAGAFDNLNSNRHAFTSEPRYGLKNRSLGTVCIKLRIALLIASAFLSTGMSLVMGCMSKERLTSLNALDIRCTAIINVTTCIIFYLYCYSYSFNSCFSDGMSSCMISWMTFFFFSSLTKVGMVISFQISLIS